MTGVYRLRKNGKLIEYYQVGPNGEPPSYDMEWTNIIDIFNNVLFHDEAHMNIYPLVEGDKIEIECLLRD